MAAGSKLRLSEAMDISDNASARERTPFDAKRERDRIDPFRVQGRLVGERRVAVVVVGKAYGFAVRPEKPLAVRGGRQATARERRSPVQHARFAAVLPGQPSQAADGPPWKGGLNAEILTGLVAERAVCSGAPNRP